MKVKNISGKVLNLNDGPCKDGESADVDFDMAKFLFGQNLAEQVTDKPKSVVKPAVKKEAKTDG